MQDAIKYTQKLLEYLPLKAGFGFLFVCLSYIFNGEIHILYTIFGLIFIDTFTGVYVAINGKNVNSKDFFRSAKKSFFYFLMIVTARLVDKQLPVKISAPVIDAFVSTTEAVSIFENLAKLGFPVPTFLINKLKVFYEQKGNE